MKKAILLVLALTTFFLMTNASALAQGKISVGVGADVILPLGDFGDAYSTGFGGTARGQYMVNEQVSVMLTIGYLTFSVKDVPAGTSIDNATMIPIVVGAKYFFMPTGSFRPYGAFELGLTSFSQSLSGTSGGTSFNFGSATSTEFTYAPAIGFESALGSGNTKIDVAVRWNGISDASGIGARVGVLFGVGN